MVNTIKELISTLYGLTEKFVLPRDVVYPRKYYNLKLVYAFILQAECIAYSKFTYISASNAGSTNGYIALQLCGLCRLLTENVTQSWSIIFFDDTYEHVGNVLRPFSWSKNTDVQDSNNYSISNQSSNMIII